MLNTFYDDIQIANEKMLQDPQTGKLKLEVQDLVEYYETTKKIRSIDAVVGRTPVFVLCSYCKDLRDKYGEWHPIEQILNKFPENSNFSHGICDKCLDRTMYIIDLEKKVAGNIHEGSRCN